MGSMISAQIQRKISHGPPPALDYSNTHSKEWGRGALEILPSVKAGEPMNGLEPHRDTVSPESMGGAGIKQTWPAWCVGVSFQTQPT